MILSFIRQTKQKYNAVIIVAEWFLYKQVSFVNKLDLLYNIGVTTLYNIVHRKRWSNERA